MVGASVLNVGVDVGDELIEGACETELGCALNVGDDVGCTLMDGA